MQESDVLLKQISKTGVDRTVINKASSSDKHQVAPSRILDFRISPIVFLSVGVDAFMAAIEKDANERAESRRQHKIVADEFKRKGNDAFHQQLYDQAIDFYTQVGINAPLRTTHRCQRLSAGFTNEEGLRRSVHQSCTGACETGTLRQGHRGLRLGFESEHLESISNVISSLFAGHPHVDQGSHH